LSGRGASYFSALERGKILKWEHPFTLFSEEGRAMPTKVFKPPRIAPLQRVVAKIVTDPVEIAAIEKLI
jgi:hypothetical protein